MKNLLAMALKDELEIFDKELSIRQEYYILEQRMEKWRRIIRKWKKRKVIL